MCVCVCVCVCVCSLSAGARGAGASALAACVGLTATSSAGTTVLSPVYTPNTRPTLQWNGLPEKYKFDPFVDSEHTDDYYTKDNKDAWGPKVRASPRESARLGQCA